MKNSQNKKTLQISLLVLIAILMLGIGYAGISAINAIINVNGTVAANQENFKIYFVTSTITTGTGTASIDDNDNTIAYFNITGLSKTGDTAVATYTVLNNSNSVGANISLNVTNSNSEYFKVTESIGDTQLQAGDTTEATVTVEMIKTPLDSDVSTNISAKLVANPIENAQATGNNPASKVAGDPESFATDSWATIQKAIQNNNTDVYNIGDTKTITINNTNYTVRIANKSINENCSNENYSETACGFVVEFENIISIMAMNNSANTNVGGYPTTVVRNYLNSTLYNQMPTDLKNVIKTTRVISGHGTNDSDNFTTTDRIYLLSSMEVFGEDEYDSAASTTTQFDFYRINGSELRHFTGGPPQGYYVQVQIGADKKHPSGYNDWWFRNADSSGDLTYRAVGQEGGITTPSPHGEIMKSGVSPAFRVG